jgi:hypothetical protein
MLARHYCVSWGSRRAIAWRQGRRCMGTVEGVARPVRELNKEIEKQIVQQYEAAKMNSW